MKKKLKTECTQTLGTDVRSRAELTRGKPKLGHALRNSLNNLDAQRSPAKATKSLTPLLRLWRSLRLYDQLKKWQSGCGAIVCELKIPHDEGL